MKVRAQAPRQDSLDDLDWARDLVMAGRTYPEAIATENPAFYRKYGRTIRCMHTSFLRTQHRTEMTKGVWYTGSGAAGAAFRDYDAETHFVKDLSTRWWDGYRGQPIVIFNGFEGQVGFGDLMSLVDKWPRTVPVKRGRGRVQFLAKEVRIASSSTPASVYPDEDMSPFDRRFEVFDVLGA
jgi:hypothetical protein